MARCARADWKMAKSVRSGVASLTITGGWRSCLASLGLRSEPGSGPSSSSRLTSSTPQQESGLPGAHTGTREQPLTSTSASTSSSRYVELLSVKASSHVVIASPADFSRGSGGAFAFALALLASLGRVLESVSSCMVACSSDAFCRRGPKILSSAQASGHARGNRTNMSIRTTGEKNAAMASLLGLVQKACGSTSPRVRMAAAETMMASQSGMSLSRKTGRASEAPT
mmetsp:Transcript_43014/g.103308  ORF Transcript_43014/g.103308 Transcript_43014/m.103308 type:complete len:227 (-) Transcript_43014:797-1477(-)